MEMQTKESGQNLLVSLAGELFGDDTAEVQKAVTDYVGVSEQCSTVVWIDLSGLAFVDSIGLGMFMGLHRSCKKTGATLKFVGPSEHVLRQFVAVRFTRVLDIVNQEQAHSQAPDLF